MSVATFRLEIKIGNAAMSRRSDISDTLSDISVKVEHGQVEGNIMDRNGNTVGKFWME